jgi:hypothetical protein
MGMNMGLHYLSWVGFYMTLNTIFSIIWALIIKGGFFKTTEYFMIFFIYWLLGFFMISLAIFLHAFFTAAKPAVLSAIIAFFILYGVNVGLQSSSGASEGTLVGYSFSPFAALEQLGKTILSVEATKQPFDWALFWVSIAKYKYGYFWLITFFESIFLLFLGMWLDMIWPSEIGVRRHPLFCLGFPCKRNSAR